MGAGYKPRNWEEIMLCRGYGKGVNATAKELGISPSVVSNVFNAFDAVKAADWDKCCHMINNWRTNIEVFVWVASKVGVELPDRLEKEYLGRVQRDKERATAAKKEDSKAAAVSAENEGIVALKMLELLAKNNELLEQLMDVVIPKYCADLKDNFNANCDIICERLKSCEDKLEGIKVNVRKRGL